MQILSYLSLLKTLCVVLEIEIKFLNTAHGALHILVSTCLSRQLSHILSHSSCSKHRNLPPGSQIITFFHLQVFIYAACFARTVILYMLLRISCLSLKSLCWQAILNAIDRPYIPKVSCTWPFKIAITRVTFCLMSIFPTNCANRYLSEAHDSICVISLSPEPHTK